jgi:deoxyxylulose-5-phosphate synthase
LGATVVNMRWVKPLDVELLLKPWPLNMKPW